MNVRRILAFIVEALNLATVFIEEIATVAVSSIFSNGFYQRTVVFEYFSDGMENRLVPAP